ncbi:C45 family peptidase [Kitasatospora sp. NPDC048722]|uniref:C45 family peptidase n=1 Tax=Kitasatospora sp. NPDC048722 TaxID=3155639 RepID=UPI003406C3AA
MKPIGYWLNRTDKALTAHMNGMPADFGLTRTAWQVLNVVDDTPEAGDADVHAALAANADAPARTAAVATVLADGWTTRPAPAPGRLALSSGVVNYPRISLGRPRLTRCRTRGTATMSQHEMTFRAIDVGDGGDGRWAAHAQALWPLAEEWMSEEGRSPEGADRARKLFEAHMPELVPVLDRLARRLDRPGGGTFLTLAAVRPFFSGCTQIGGSGTLLRNYDFSPDACEGTVVSSRFLRPVIGMQEALWGLLDGMNDAGLAVSLTFGGRFVHGPGFSIVIVLRYLLETCDTVDEAIGRLRSIPIAIPQNVTLVDSRRAVTVFVGPDIPLTVASDACAANHQHLPVPDEQERFSRTRERLSAVRAAGTDVVAMLRPPLYQSAYEEGLGTVYTAHYRPREGRVSYVWPGESWEQSFDDFAVGSRTVTAGRAG